MYNDFDKSQNAIFRAFCIREYLETQLESDTETVCLKSICEWLEQNYPGDNITRQSVTKYLDVIYQYDQKRNELQGFQSGLQIRETGSNQKQVKYVYKKVLTSEQLSMLMELVYSSIFLDKQTAEELSYSLVECANTSGCDAIMSMNSVVRPFNGENLEAFSNLKILHEAINDGRPIKYYLGSVNAKLQDGYYKKDSKGNCTWNWTDQKNVKHKEKIAKEQSGKIFGGKLLVYPYKIMWDNSRCYLIGMTQSYKTNKWEIRTFRVDRMYELKIEPIGMNKNVPEGTVFYNEKEPFCFDVQKFMSSVFKMWPAEERYRKIQFSVRMDKINIIRDRFGDVTILPLKNDKSHCYFETGIQVTNTFFSWLAGFQPNELRIMYPTEIQDEYLTYLKNIFDGYGKKD